jgi:hypothetical protein
VHRNRVASNGSYGSTTADGDRTLYLLDCGNERVWSLGLFLSHEPYEANEELIAERKMYDKGDVIYHMSKDRYGIVMDVEEVKKKITWMRGRRSIEVCYRYVAIFGLDKCHFSQRGYEWGHIAKADCVVR